MYESKNLVLRKAVFSDWKAIYQNVWRYSETAQYMLWEPTQDEEAAKARMERTLLFQRDHSAWFVYDKESQQPIGFAGFCMVDEGVFEDTGIALGPDYVGKGLGTQLLNLLTQIAQEQYNAKRFIATCRSQNAASRGMILRNGFRFIRQEPRTDPRDGNGYVLEFYEKELSCVE